MKLTKKIVALVAVLMTTASVLASEVTVITMLNGVASSTGGTVAHSESGGVCTLTVTPADGYYIDVVTAEKTVDGGIAQSRRRTTPGMDNYLDVTAPQSPYDPSGKTTWTFTMPDDESYNVEVIANFKARTSITGATITLAATEVTYTAEAITPAVTKVVAGGKELAEGDYEVSYSNNIDAGTATVTVTGKKTYTGTATTTFTIKKAALNLTVMLEGWIYGEYNEEVNALHVDGNEGEGQETVSYKVKGAGDDTYSPNLPSDAGIYVVKVDVAATDNYAAGSATAEFTIARADLDLTLTLQGWTYGDAAQTPSLSGNDGNGAVTYSYANAEAASAEYTTNVPTNAGSYIIKAVVAVTTNYNAGEATANFTIAKANLSGVTIADIADQTYTGEAITPTVNVTFKDEAVAATEYTVGYSNNTGVGEATVTLTATGVNFTAGTTATKTFQIVPASVNISAEDQTVTYNGNAQAYTGATVAKGSLSIKYATSQDADAEKTTTAPTNAGVYYVTISQTDPNYTSQDATATFTIEAKELTNDMVQNLAQTSFNYDGSAKTLSFSMYDAELKSGLTENTDYTVTYSDNINVGTATATVTGKNNYTGSFTLDFDILRKLNISFSETNSWATYCATEDLTIPGGLNAYVVTSITGSAVEVEEISFIPEGQGVLLHLEEPAFASDDFIAAKDNGAHGELPNNYLEGVTAATSVSALAADASIYVLYNDEFVKTTSGTIKANRCYLPISMNVNARLAISFADDDNETTAIENVNRETITNNNYYDMQGRKVAQPAKGLYIVNGKKVVIK